jgi:putative acetyltransferase
MIEVRVERPQDVSQVHTVNERAFARPAEADLVDELRRAFGDFLSLVAEDDEAQDDEVVGHILFTPAVIGPAAIEGPGRSITGMGLAPMAVMPDRQRQGIGLALVKRGLEILRERGCPFVVVLGHPNYYPRFGFERASTHGLSCQWEGVPDEAFMVLILDSDAMRGVSGVVKYRNEFNEAV